VEAVIAGHMADLFDEDRELLQAASVQGEQFTAEVVAYALGWDEEMVIRRLSGPLETRHRLVQAVRLERLDSNGQRLSSYRFRHLLVQHSAYRSLDVARRARLHEATGRALQKMYASPVGQATAAQAEWAESQTLAIDLARHFELAGMPLEAASQRLKAGRWAARLLAFGDSIIHLEHGLTLLARLPSTREQMRLELALLSALINPALLHGGWQSPTFTRAL
jgi:predicted ATPase